MRLWHGHATTYLVGLEIAMVHNNIQICNTAGDGTRWVCNVRWFTANIRINTLRSHTKRVRRNGTSKPWRHSESFTWGKRWVPRRVHETDLFGYCTKGQLPISTRVL